MVIKQNFRSAEPTTFQAAKLFVRPRQFSLRLLLLLMGLSSFTFFQRTSPWLLVYNENKMWNCFLHFIHGPRTCTDKKKFNTEWTPFFSRVFFFFSVRLFCADVRVSQSLAFCLTIWRMCLQNWSWKLRSNRSIKSDIFFLEKPDLFECVTMFSKWIWNAYLLWCYHELKRFTWWFVFYLPLLQFIDA